MDIDNELEENETDVKVKEFAAHLGLEILHTCKSGSMHMATLNINRPGLQLSGYYEHFGKDRVQVIGEMETAYSKQLNGSDRLNALEKLFSFGFPCLVISSGLEPCAEIIACAEKYDKTVLRSKQRSTMIINGLSIYLNELLAPRIVTHGVLLDLYGVGVLMTGKSSVGKSETAIELIQRGHRLVADDAVCIKRVSDRLVGSSPELIRYMMEVRGIGIVDIRRLYGAGAVKLTKVIDMVVNLETWDEEKEYDRLGGSTATKDILGIEIPSYTIPVKSGRNLAVILEVAARNHRIKGMGFDIVKELERRQMTASDNDIWQED